MTEAPTAFGATRRDRIPDHIVILRRLLQPRPGNPATTVPDQSGMGNRATSFALRPRANESFPSWSISISANSPEQLIDQADYDNCDVRGASVCAVRVAQVRELGLDVVLDPTMEDPNHCLMVPQPNGRFSDKVWSKLAKLTRVVYDHPA